MSNLIRHEKLFVLLSIGVLSIALFLNLDAHHMFIHTDEPRRALVALEMMLSDNYIVPTLNGEVYYNKPPLFNWIIVLSFMLWGEESEWALRFPVVISVIGFSFSIYYFTRKHLDKRVAIFTALAFVTSGRVLFYDSFLGLIDITYAWMIYLSVMFLFFFLEQKKFILAFSLAYLFTALAYMMKGLPALVFVGTSIAVWLIIQRQVRVLFSLQHLLGIGVFLALIISYYLTFSNYHPGEITALFSTLWQESAKRTIIEYGFTSVLKQMLSFPFEMAFHFLPWSLLLFLLFRWSALVTVWYNQFLRFCLIIFLANIIIYWTSPEVYPRYLFPFVPLISAVLMHLYFSEIQKNWQKSTINFVMFLLIVVSTTLIAYLPFVERIQAFDFYYLKVILLFLCLISLLLITYKYPKTLFFNLILTLGLLRIAVDWFNLPERHHQRAIYKTQALKVAELSRNEPLYLYRNSQTHDGSCFYISKSRKSILYRTQETKDYPSWYIVGEDLLYLFDAETVRYEFHTLGLDNPLYLLKLDGATSAIKNKEAS